MSRHWVLTTWNAKAMAGFPASIAAPLARCALSSRSMAGAAIAAAQGSPAPGANQAFLYEMDEDAVLLNSAGQVLVPDPSGKSPTGLVDATNGAVGIPAVRHATSQLQGVAALGSILCSVPQLVTVRGNECTVIATGTDDVQL